MGEALDKSVALLHDMTGCSPDMALAFIKSLPAAVGELTPEDMGRPEEQPEQNPAAATEEKPGEPPSPSGEANGQTPA